ncbi:MAG TPA: 2-hydroxyacid dehydrogenase [Cytophagaceae bacterium]
MKTIVYSTQPFDKEYLNKSNSGKHEILFETLPLNLKTAQLAKGCNAVCIFVNDDASAEVLKLLKGQGVSYIVARCAGTDQIDLKAARELGIKVANVPEYSPYSIAEHSVAMMMALNRKLVLADKKVKDYDFRLDDLIGFDMNEKKVGIIGLGKIGGVVAKILHGFGCRILAYDPEINDEYMKKYGVHYCSLEALCVESDIITIHAPLNEHTKYLINKKTLGLMKKGVMIINTGRGGIINTNDLIEALKSGHVGSAGLDVYEKEKGLFFFDHSHDIPEDDMFARLLTFKNVLITGHQAFLTENALTNISDTVIENIEAWEKGAKPKFEL